MFFNIKLFIYILFQIIFILPFIQLHISLFIIIISINSNKYLKYFSYKNKKHYKFIF